MEVKVDPQAAKVLFNDDNDLSSLRLIKDGRAWALVKVGDKASDSLPADISGFVHGQEEQKFQSFNGLEKALTVDTLQKLRFDAALASNDFNAGEQAINEMEKVASTALAQWLEEEEDSDTLDASSGDDAFGLYPSAASTPYVDAAFDPYADTISDNAPAPETIANRYLEATQPQKIDDESFALVGALETLSPSFLKLHELANDRWPRQSLPADVDDLSLDKSNNELLEQLGELRKPVSNAEELVQRIALWKSDESSLGKNAILQHLLLHETSQGSKLIRGNIPRFTLGKNDLVKGLRDIVENLMAADPSKLEAMKVQIEIIKNEPDVQKQRAAYKTVSREIMLLRNRKFFLGRSLARQALVDLSQLEGSTSFLFKLKEALAKGDHSQAVKLAQETTEAFVHLFNTERRPSEKRISALKAFISKLEAFNKLEPPLNEVQQDGINELLSLCRGKLHTLEQLHTSEQSFQEFRQAKANKESPTKFPALIEAMKKQGLIGKLRSVERVKEKAIELHYNLEKLDPLHRLWWKNAGPEAIALWQSSDTEDSFLSFIEGLTASPLGEFGLLTSPQNHLIQAEYLNNAEERKPFRTRVRRGDDQKVQLLQQGEEYHLRTQGSNTLFALSKGTLLARPELGGTFFHSGFFAGSPVDCAGEIRELDDGDIVFLPLTGHYRNSNEALYSLVQHLRQALDGDLKGVQIGIPVTDDLGKFVLLDENGKERIEYLSAQEFFEKEQQRRLSST